MKKTYSYSEQKFTKFTFKKKIAIISEMLEVLEKNFTLEEYSRNIKNSILACFSFLKEGGKELGITISDYDLDKLADITKLRDILIKLKGEFLRDSDIVVKRYDSHKLKEDKFPLVVMLDNLRSAFNVGAIIRTSECLGVSEIALCGQTPDQKNRKVSETSMGTSEFIKIINFNSTLEAINYYKGKNYEIIALELTNQSLKLKEYMPLDKVALLVGNESLGLNEEILKECDKIIEITMYGIKNSLNVSNATAIAIHNIINKWR